MEKTYTIDDKKRCVFPIWGWAQCWKSHLKVAEGRKYRLRTLWGFSVDTENKIIEVSDGQRKVFDSVYAGQNGNPNDMKDYLVFCDAVKYLKPKGYKTNF